MRSSLDMSIEKHPIFHAVEFAAKIMDLIVSCRRGIAADPRMVSCILSDDVCDEVHDFTCRIEKMVDMSVHRRLSGEKTGV